MRVCVVLFFLGLLVAACGGDNRVYEKYVDFEDRHWLVSQAPEFEFEILDTQARYDIVGNIRNEVSYPWSRIFITYYLKDSTGTQLHKNLLGNYLFDAKSGKPLGTSGLGDIYDHQLLLLGNYQFPKPGKYTMKLEQFMRKDTLDGILAVGLRVEKIVP
jgi:gliding motility-associated lipoprotein GldH